MEKSRKTTPGKLPDGAELERLNSIEGLTYQQIAERYDASTNSVYRKLANYRRHPKVVQRLHLDTIPWKGVLRKHTSLYDGVMLAALDDRNHGRELPPVKDRSLTSWLKMMDENNLVIDYDREKGWLRVPRRPEDGDGYVRMPPPELRRS